MNANDDRLARLARIWPRLPLGARLRLVWAVGKWHCRMHGYDWVLAIAFSLGVSMWVESESGLLPGFMIFFTLLNCLRATLLYNQGVA